MTLYRFRDSGNGHGHPAVEDPSGCKSRPGDSGPQGSFNLAGVGSSDGVTRLTGYDIPGFLLNAGPRIAQP